MEPHVSPDEGNAAVRRANGIYVPTSGGGEPNLEWHDIPAEWYASPWGPDPDYPPVYAVFGSMFFIKGCFKTPTAITSTSAAIPVINVSEEYRVNGPNISAFTPITGTTYATISCGSPGVGIYRQTDFTKLGTNQGLVNIIANRVYAVNTMWTF